MNESRSSIATTALSTQAANDEFDEVVADAKIREHVIRQYEQRLNKKKIVTGDDISEMLQHMDLATDDNELRPLLPDWNNCTADDCVEAINTIRISQGSDLETLLARLESDVVHLSPWQYMRYKLPCLEKDPSWQYRVVRLDMNVAPRHMLFASTGVVLLFTGMAILVLMSLLWLNQANDRELVQMKNFHLLLSSFTQSFEQHFIKAHAETMVDQVDTMAKMIEKQQEFIATAQDQEMINDVKFMASMLDTTGATAVDRVASEVEGSIAAIVDAFDTTDSGLSTDDLKTLIRGLNTEYGDDIASNWEMVAVQHPTAGSTAVLVESRKIECSYGPCEYAAVPCLQRQGDAKVHVLADSKNVHRNDVLAVFASIPTRNVTVCASIPTAMVISARDKVLVDTVASWNAIFRETYGYKREILLGRLPANADSSITTWISPFLRKQHDCYNPKSTESSHCTGLDELTIRSLKTGSALKETVTGYSSVLLHAAAAPTKYEIAVVLSLTDEGFIETSRQEIVDIMNYLNFNSKRTTELSIARRDPKTGVVIAQVNKFRFEENCYDGCERIPPSTLGARRGLETKSSGWVITPDYRPEPVLGAYSFIGNRIDMVIIIERDVMEIRTIGLNALTNIFNENNNKYTGSLEAQLVRFNGSLPMRTYDRNARCDHIKECIVHDKFGTIFRSDCVHCVRAPELNTDQIEYLTALKSDCEHENCTASVAGGHGVAKEPLVRRNEKSESIYGTDYRGKEVLAVFSFVSNFSVGLVVKLDRDEIEGPITSMIAIAVGTAVAIVFIGLVLLIFFSRKVLDKIEFEWLSYKKQIDQEKEKFDDMVQDVIPKAIKEDLIANQKQSVSLPSLSIIFVDICNLSEKSKNWSPEMVCRYLTYTFAVIEETANYFRLNKVRFYGDTYFGVGGLSDPKNIDHAMYRSASFGSVLVQLFSNKFAHYPDRIPVIRRTFEEVVAKQGPAFPDVQGNYDDVGHLVAPNLRIGMHYGVGTFCMIETGRTPTFDIFGSSVALAARMQATSQPNKMHLTGAAKEVLERMDKDHQFEFDDARRTVVKGQGTITSFFINSANVAIPSQIIVNLGIEYANLRVFYEEQSNATAGGGTLDGKQTASRSE